ncbi:MAG: hypothetical protein QM478_11575 [Flavobacteriaceae bacterium]
MSVTVRGSFYRALKMISHSNYITIGSLVRQLVTHDFRLNKIDSDEFNRAFASVREIRELGIILNNYTKQVNANILHRKQIDESFISAFEIIVSRAKDHFFKWRESNYSAFFEDLKVEREGDISKINERYLSPRKWHVLNLSLNSDDIFNINSITNQLGISHGKFINSIIKLFLNQGNFFDKETKQLQGFFIKSLSVIKVNAFQILRNKKKNAFENEKLIAEKIINFTDIILNELKNDPVLYSGRKFDEARFNLTLNKFEDCLI